METKVATKTISVGVIGTGGIGTRHAVNLHRFIGGAQVTGGLFTLCPAMKSKTDPSRCRTGGVRPRQ
jgi:hypothetical protein